MYRNFNLTDEERKQIMEQHAAHGYKKPLNEQSLTNNQRLASQKGYGSVSVEYADQLGKEGKLLATAPNNQPAQNSASAPAGSAPASAAAEVKAPDINVNCAASLAEIKKGSLKILKYGCKTDAVKELQKMLGMEEKYQTGYFGNMTKAKVIEFQKANKDAEGKDLVPDGKVGDKTYAVMAYKKITTTTDTQKTAADAITNKALSLIHI
jgi:peptidoglycan hydrolase-like protein with peptidoglycan-binding domain